MTHLHEQLEIDLTSVENLSKSNDGVRFLLFAIDVFSRYLWVKPLKDKKGKTILTALQAILDGIKLSKIRSDKGSEFVNAPVKNYLKKKGIYFFSTNNPVKASLVERVQRTFKQRLFRYLRNKRNDRYIDDLQKLVNNYNLTPHSSLNNTAPKNVNKNNEADIWAYMYLKNQKGKKTKRVAPYRYKVGDYVRISYLRHPFRKLYEQQFTSRFSGLKDVGGYKVFQSTR